MYCLKCGNKIETDSMFCSLCGANQNPIVEVNHATHQKPTVTMNRGNNVNVKRTTTNTTLGWGALIGGIACLLICYPFNYLVVSYLETTTSPLIIGIFAGIFSLGFPLWAFEGFEYFAKAVLGKEGLNPHKKYWRVVFGIIFGVLAILSALSPIIYIIQLLQGNPVVFQSSRLLTALNGVSALAIWASLARVTYGSFNSR
jgi:hypothetical protein